MIRLEARVSHPERAQLGEGPLWHGEALFWVDILGGRVLRSAETGTKVLRTLGEPVSAVFPHTDGGFVLLIDSRIEFVDDVFATTRCIEVFPAGGDSRLSDGAIGPGGELWFGSLRHDLQPGGALYRLRPGETAPTVVHEGLGMPNGIAFSPDLAHMYFVDSAARTLTVWDYEPIGMEVSSPRVLATFDEADGTPDGIAVDAVGGVWVAHWAGGSVRRLELDGSWSQEVLVPADNVTSCVFGGPNLQTLFITTATAGLGPSELAAQPSAGSVFSITLPIGGTVAQAAKV
ncbi:MULTISPECIES: SMP-30/gluconolactonase/LRE family protein [unclassified Leucobacter]|uniref:SMP-30/gluconolactonase/LRE family protein n=1 Tax=unclassified Leucobacter TaxID=2621730 RepID=UPI00165E1AEB|nr:MULTISPECIES: SMP-30/gluconolactonase/LRE family protein [unclassified Leucobacter]MBC9935836.1 SMP-30/gluconolactonase/LRE family protein [Leucobacter sp. cx-87]